MKTTLLITLALFLSGSFAQEVSISQSVRIIWDKNPEQDISYRVHVGKESGTYESSFDAPDNRYSLPAADHAQFAAVTAVNAAGLESGFSNEVKIPALPTAPVNVRVVININVDGTAQP